MKTVLPHRSIEHPFRPFKEIKNYNKTKTENSESRPMSLESSVFLRSSAELPINRTLFEVKNKKFVPKKVAYTVESTLASPSSLKAKWS